MSQRPPDLSELSPLAPPTLTRRPDSPAPSPEPSLGGDDPARMEISSVDILSATASDRYDILGRLGAGTSGEVFRVKDLHLNRVLAMKVLLTHFSIDNEARERFLSEAQAMARLQHPGILPIYDLGETIDGRPFFTMQEVRGENLAQLLHRRQQDEETADEWPISRLLEVFRQACAIVAFAHTRATLHLDIKPENILIGEQDAVYVVDWGLTEDDHAIRQQAEGTLAYLAPEQVTSTGRPLDARVDVYSLGAVLYHLLTGEPPFVGTPDEVLARVRNEVPVPLSERAPHIAPALQAMVTKAMARNTNERFDSARELGANIGDWLDGSQTRARVQRLVELACSRIDDAKILQGQATHIRQQAARIRASLQPWAPEVEKHRVWDLEDRADLLESEARFKFQERRQLFHAAVTHAPEMVEPHLGLIACFRDEHDEAEARGDEPARRMAEERLREHLAAIPADHPERAVQLQWLRGYGRLSLTVDAQPTALLLERYTPHRRRLRLSPVRPLMSAPLEEMALPMGSYRLHIAAEGRAEVVVPVLVGRGAHWNPRSPHSETPAVVHLPTAGALGPDDRLVTAGPALLSNGPRTHQEVWVDAFVIRAHPVTNREYLSFLNSLIDNHHIDDAIAFSPVLPTRELGVLARAWNRAPDGHFRLPTTPTGVMAWHADAPVVGVSWIAATAFADWESGRTGHSWRLPHELEWEKAARGVDGRRFPWGHGADPSRAWVEGSCPTPMGPAPVNAAPADESPYGVRHLAGNVAEWCANPFSTASPVDQGRITWPSADAASLRTVRGHSWRSRTLDHALSIRHSLPPHATKDWVGFRLVRSLPRPNEQSDSRCSV